MLTLIQHCTDSAHSAEVSLDCRCLGTRLRRRGETSASGCPGARQSSLAATRSGAGGGGTDRAGQEGEEKEQNEGAKKEKKYLSKNLRKLI